MQILIREKLKELEQKDIKSPAFGDKPTRVGGKRSYLTHKRGQSSPMVSGGPEKCSYTLKQVKDLIADIYLQKVKHDEKCVN